MARMTPELDIVVVTYNSARVIGNLLDSIPAALDGVLAQVTVVDNGSADTTVELLLSRGDCHVVRSRNDGYSAGINRGVREGSGANAILVLNPDTRLHEGSIAPMLKALEMPGVGIVVPRIVSEAGQLEFSLRRAPSLLRALGLTRTRMPALSEYVQEPSAYTYPHDVEWATGAVIMMSRGCFDALDGWDESFFLYSEETDFSLRAREIGLATRFEPEAVAMHIGGGSGRNSKTQAMQAINRVRLYRRSHNIVAAWSYYWLIMASEALWGLRGHAQCTYAAAALLRPSLRPAELNCSPTLLPGWTRK
jgi:GT2 family glycosyltransferase